MPRSRPLRLPLGAFGAVGALCFAVGCAPRVERPPAPDPAGPEDAVRAARVVAGLRPPVEAIGRAPTRWSLAERMAHHRVPGVSIAIVEDGRVAWARGLGVVEAGAATPVTPATLFQAASISKPVTATAMLRLVERGALDLDVDVNRYLTSWKVPESPHSAVEKVTLRRLASHTAGLTVHGFPGYRAGAPVPTVPQVLDGAPPANTAPVRVDTTPGAIWRYSGGGTTVLQQVLVDATGTPFPTLMRDLVLTPAGMTRSTYEQPLPASRAGEAARAHDRSGAAIPGGWHAYPEMAAAGLWTTPTDLARWALAIAAARAGRPGALLSTTTAARMLTAVRNGYALGPGVGGSGRGVRFGHGGANAGFHSEVVMYPELGVGAAVMTNGDGGPPLIQEVMRAIAAEYGWPDRAPRRVPVVALDSVAAAGLAGDYRLAVSGGIPAQVRLERGSLVLRVPRLPDQELLPQSDTTFVGTADGWLVTFARDAAGRGIGLTVTRDGAPPIEGTRTR